MKRWGMVFVVWALCLTSYGFSQQNDGDQMVQVPKKYVSAEGLAHQVTIPEPTPVETVSKWVGIGKEVGIATKEGLGAVVDESQRFGSSKVGTFVMLMIAWKIMAKDVFGIILGIPLLFCGIALWVWTMKRFFLGYRVVIKQEGKVKEWGDHPPYEFVSRDARSTAGTFAIIFLFLWVAIMVFSVIF